MACRLCYKPVAKTNMSKHLKTMHNGQGVRRYNPKL